MGSVWSMAAIIKALCACAEAKQCGEGNTAAGSADSSGAQLFPHGRAVPRPQLCAARLHVGPCRHRHRRAGLPHPGSLHGERSDLSLAQLGLSAYLRSCSSYVCVMSTSIMVMTSPPNANGPPPCLAGVMLHLFHSISSQ